MVNKMKIPLPHILLDEEIYPRERIDPRRIAIFAENIRDGLTFDPIEVHPPRCPSNHRILDCCTQMDLHLKICRMKRPCIPRSGLQRD
ncbi:hypothetical protein JXL19_08695 [bacterium]|nr:hypothetical protein [bacterium]